MTSALHQQVRRTIRRHELCPPGTRLLVGLSGGSDSVALVLILLDLAAHGDFTVAGLAHFNHRLRPTADRDERFCSDLADRLGLSILIESADVKAYAASQRLSVEDAARRVRYDFLHRAAGQTSSSRIAVGHTRDDQAETFLLKLVRGAGLAGLGGIYPRRGQVVRPLLDTSRDELRAFLVERGQAWIDDESNEDVANPRNRIRHRVLPQLAETLGGDARASIARTADLMRDDGAWLHELSAGRYGQIATGGGNSVQIDADALAAEPLPVRRRIVLMALRTLAGDREIGLDHVQSVLDTADGTVGGVDLPGSRAELRGRTVVLLRQGNALK